MTGAFNCCIRCFPFLLSLLPYSPLHSLLLSLLPLSISPTFSLYHSPSMQTQQMRESAEKRETFQVHGETTVFIPNPIELISIFSSSFFSNKCLEGIRVNHGSNLFFLLAAIGKLREKSKDCIQRHLEAIQPGVNAKPNGIAYYSISLSLFYPVPLYSKYNSYIVSASLTFLVTICWRIRAPFCRIGVQGKRGKGEIHPLEEEIRFTYRRRR